MTTSVIQSPRYYSHFFSAQQNGDTFSYKKNPLTRSPVNITNGQILKSQTVDSFMISPR